MIARRRFPNGYVAKAKAVQFYANGMVVANYCSPRLGLCLGVVKADLPYQCRICGGLRVLPYPCGRCGPDGMEAIINSTE